MFCILRSLLEDVLHFTLSSETFLQFAKVVEFFRIFLFLVVSCILMLPQKTPKKDFYDAGSKCHFCTTPVV